METLDRLYERSVADLEAHKLVLDGPSRARVGVRKNAACVDNSPRLNFSENVISAGGVLVVGGCPGGF